MHEVDKAQLGKVSGGTRESSRSTSRGRSDSSRPSRGEHSRHDASGGQSRGLPPYQEPKKKDY